MIFTRSGVVGPGGGEFAGEVAEAEVIYDFRLMIFDLRKGLGRRRRNKAKEN
jgi:hypothetical protein